MIMPVEVDGMILHAEETEAGMISQIFNGQEYGAVPWESLDSPIVIDIGANIGAFACYAHSKSSSSRIHCFEPNPKSVELLVMNAPFATIHPVALGGMDCQAMLRLNKAGSFADSFRVPMVADPEGYQLVTIRDAGSVWDEVGLGVSNLVDVLKIDAEGCEVEILRSLGSRLVYVRFIQIEYHSELDRRMIDIMLHSFSLLASFVHGPGLGVLTYRQF